MVKIVQNSFLGGQLDFEMMGRQDIEKYAKGATILRNFVPIRRGGIRKRPGTDVIHDVTSAVSSASAYRLVPFAYRLDEGWALLFTPSAILAISRTQTVNVVAATGSSLYTAAQIPELDYCQSGDVMFIAHPTHKPARIEHVVNNGVHTFTLREINMNARTLGVPSITSATVVKQGILDRGGVVTESYVATAVFGGVETVPSSPFSGGSASDTVEAAYQAWKEYAEIKSNQNKVVPFEFTPQKVSYAGTSYHAPWTESQTITLNISVPSRTINGVIETAEQVRIYRKSGSFYGLVGFVQLSGSSQEIDSGVSVPNYAPTQVGLPSDERIFASAGLAQDATTAQKNRARYDAIFSASSPQIALQDQLINVSFSNPISRASVEVWAGTIAFTDDSTDDNGEGSVTMTYTALANTSRRQFKVITVSANETQSETASTVTLPSRTSQTNTWTTTVSYSPSATGDSPKNYDEAKDAAMAAFNAAAVAGSFTPIGSSTTITRSAKFNAMRIEKNSTHAITIVALRVTDTTPTPTPGPGSSVTWTDKYYTPDVSTTPPRKDQFMNSAGEYPSCVCLSQQRLIWASTAKNPARVLMSEIGDFYTYSAHEAMVEDDPIDFMISATRFPKVNHIVELRKLIMFNGDAEWIVDSASANSGITFSTIQARQHSAIGAAAWLKPIVCNNVLLFAERTGKAVRMYGYQLEDDGFGGEDVSIFSSSIFRDGKIVSWTYQQHPNSTCWCVMDDGTMCSLTFLREQNAIAWATHALGGGGLVRDIACTHALRGTGMTADTSDVFLLVERSGTWTVEAFRTDCAHGNDSIGNAVCLDSAKVSEANGETRRAGTVLVNLLSGSVSSDPSAATVAGATVEGFPFESVFTSVYPVVATDVGLAQMDVKCCQHAHLRMADAIGGTVRGIGVPKEQASRLVEDTPSFEAGETAAAARISMPTVDENVPLVTNNDRDGRVVIEHSEPWPFTLLMLETDIECEKEDR